MTDVQPDPFARQKRLLRRARDAHADVTALLSDLRDGEGRVSALGAQDSLSTLCLILEGNSRAK